MEKEIINNQRRRLENLFTNELGIEITVVYTEIAIGINYVPDHYFVIQLGKYKIPIIAEFKVEITNLHQIKKFIEFSKKFEGIGILVSEVIDEKIKEHLREQGIGFYESSGDVFVPLNFKLNRIQEEFSSSNELIKKQGFRAESNIKLMLYFISKPSSLKSTQRELAEDLSLALGTINSALSNLEKLKLIITRGNQRYFGKFEEIVNRWRISFLDFEKKELSYGRFSPINEIFSAEWRNIDLSNLNSYWGGEAAASIKTKYLYPGAFTIYTYESSPISLLKKLRLKKDPNGTIEILKCFWPDELNDQINYTVPDFVAYCDLLNSGIDRNIETAQLLEERIKKVLKEKEY